MKKKERDPSLPVQFYGRSNPVETVLHTTYSTITDRERLSYLLTDKSPPALRIHCTDEEVGDEFFVIYYTGRSHKKVYALWCPACRAIEEAKTALALLTENP